MTTVHRVFLGRALLAPLLLAPLLLAPACADSPRPVVYPVRLRSPYPGERQLIWAVAPPRNESGVSAADELSFGDALVEQIGQVKGIDCLPLNRTLGAMRALNLASIDTPAQAKTLARALDADAVVVSSITSWMPYHPPRIGLNAAIFAPSGLLGTGRGVTDDPRALQTMAAWEAPAMGTPESVGGALSGVSLVLDASNTAIMRMVQEYGEARVEPNDPIGWERYAKSMRLYTQFACHRAVGLLLDAERRRISGGAMTQAADITEHPR